MHQKTDYSNVTAQCFINAPFERLQNDLLDLFLTHRFQPEIGLEGNFLWELEPDDFMKIANEFHSRDLQCTLHAPFHDLVPGGFDSRIVELSREKLRRAFALTRVFKPQSIVCHLGFEENKHGTKMERWLETSVATWTDLIKLAESAGTRVLPLNPKILVFAWIPAISWPLRVPAGSPGWQNLNPGWDSFIFMITMARGMITERSVRVLLAGSLAFSAKY